MHDRLDRAKYRHAGAHAQQGGQRQRAAGTGGGAGVHTFETVLNGPP